MDIKVISQSTQNKVEAKGTTYSIRADVHRMNDDVIDNVNGYLMAKDGSEIGNFQYNPGSNFSVLTYKKENIIQATQDASDFIDSLLNVSNLSL